jgi:hypothetical protein
VVVQVAPVLHHPVADRQQGRDRFLGRGLARASGNRDHPRAGSAPDRAREILQSPGGVVDPHHRRAREQVRRRIETFVDQRSDRAAVDRVADERVAVETRAAQGHEEVAALQCPGVGGQVADRETRVA